MPRKVETDYHTDTLVLFDKTDKAFLLGNSDKRTEARWVAKSLCGIQPTGRRNPLNYPIVTATMPQWLAEEKAFV